VKRRSSSPFRHRPYIDNGREPGGPNETGFNAAKAPRQRAILARAVAQADDMAAISKRA
jgi:hypothetical protein